MPKSLISSTPTTCLPAFHPALDNLAVLMDTFLKAESLISTSESSSAKRSEHALLFF
jgi:hypothetical protein